MINIFLNLFFPEQGLEIFEGLLVLIGSKRRIGSEDASDVELSDLAL